MKASLKLVRCAIYTRVSTEHGLDQEFNSLDAQYDAASAYIKSQAHAGWTLIRSRYDDGGYSGGSHAALSAELNSCGRNAANFHAQLIADRGCNLSRLNQFTWWDVIKGIAP